MAISYGAKYKNALIYSGVMEGGISSFESVVRCISCGVGFHYMFNFIYLYQMNLQADEPIGRGETQVTGCIIIEPGM